MKSIKRFRGWDPKEEKWVYGDGIWHNVKGDICKIMENVFKKDDNPPFIMHDVDPSATGEYLVNHPKHGVIYTFDVILITYHAKNSKLDESHLAVIHEGGYVPCYDDTRWVHITELFTTPDVTVEKVGDIYSPQFKNYNNKNI